MSCGRQWSRCCPPSPPSRRADAHGATTAGPWRASCSWLGSGIGWERLPREVFGCTGMTCWRRLRDWHAAGVLGDLHRVLSGAAGRDGRSRLEPGVNRQCVHTRKRGQTSPRTKIGPNPTDRGRPGTKRHLLVDARGTPLGFELSGANRHDEPDAGLHPRRRSGRAPRPRTPAMPAPQAPRRQGLRPPSMSRRVSGPLDHAAHRAPRRRAIRPPGPPPLGGRTHPGMARPLPASHHPLRAPRRHPLGLHLARLLTSLPQPDQAVLLGVLSLHPSPTNPHRRRSPSASDDRVKMPEVHMRAPPPFCHRVDRQNEERRN